MKKRVIEIVIGGIMGLYAIIVSVLSINNDEFPLGLLISAYVLGALGLHLIIYAFLFWYQ